jgi:Holliday junction DNA helicase RuvB
MLVPPFTQETLIEAALMMRNNEFLFIDEIHKLADHGPRSAENLLHILEEGRVYSEGTMRRLANFTVIGATTDADKLPETILDRFSIKPTFERYSLKEMLKIVLNFGKFFEVKLDPDTAFVIANAARRTPRVAREMVVACRDIYDATGITAWGHEVLEFVDIEPNGMGAEHRNYVLLLYKNYRRVVRGEVQFVASEATLRSSLRLPQQGLARVERFLSELGIIGRSPQGRYLTPNGIAIAQQLIKEGKG